MKTSEQKIYELEQRFRIMERQNKFLDTQLMKAEDKAGLLDRFIDVAERECVTSIRENSNPE